MRPTRVSSSKQLTVNEKYEYLSNCHHYSSTRCHCSTGKQFSWTFLSQYSVQPVNGMLVTAISINAFVLFTVIKLVCYVYSSCIYHQFHKHSLQKTIHKVALSCLAPSLLTFVSFLVVTLRHSASYKLNQLVIHRPTSDLILNAMLDPLFDFYNCLVFLFTYA